MDPRRLCQLAALLPLVLSAQQPDWLVSWPVGWTLNPGMPRHVLTASPGGNLMSARAQTAALNFGQDLMGIYVVERLDPGTGQTLWSCPLADSVMVECGVVDDSGNIYVAGQFMEDMSLCDGSMLGHTGNGLDVDLFLMKFDPTGLVLWTRNISIAQPDASSMAALAIDPNGDLWYAITDFFVTRITRVDASGTDVEFRFVDGGKTLGGMSFDPAGGLYVSGACSDNAFAFGGVNPPLPTNEPYLMYVARFKPDGTGDWARFAHDITFQHPVVVADDHGHAYLAGNAFDTTSWGGISFNGPDWVSATFLTKLDSTGQFLWGVESDPAGGALTGDLEAAARMSVALDGDGNPYLTGTLRGLVDWGNGVVSDGGVMMERTQTIVAFDPNGVALWAATSEPTAIFTTAMGITAMDDGTVHFSSHVSGQYDFTPHATNVGGDQAYVVGRINGMSTSTPDVDDLPGAMAFPSPFREGFNIAPRPGNKASVRVTDASGRSVHNGVYQDGLGRGWPAGLYAVEVQDGTLRHVLRVMKE